MTKNKKGFTLPELIIAFTIIVVLAAFAVPRFANIILKKKQESTKIALGILRSSIAQYYGKNNYTYPKDLTQKPFIGEYIESIPSAKIGKYVKDSNKVQTGDMPDNTGGWYYDSSTGMIQVNCNGTDIKGEKINNW